VTLLQIERDEIEMLKSKPVRLESASEKMPFEVTPFFLTSSAWMDRKNLSRGHSRSRGCRIHVTGIDRSQRSDLLVNE
jgi:hypothetical protein